MTKQPPRVIALGFFDGVHLGHGALLRKTADTAAALGARSCALTFDNHPDALILGAQIPLLNTVSDRADLMRRLYGMEEVILAHFDQGMMQMPWQNFISELLIGHFGAVHVVAGHDFHFGHRGEGNPERLAAECARLGLGCDIIPRVSLDDITISSTYIRKLVAQGEMERAAQFLGHPHILSGIVVHGSRLGSTTFMTPTVNFTAPASLQLPARGVYITTATVDQTAHPAVTNVGVRPTVSQSRDVWFETHLLDFSGDLYDKQVRLDFLRMLRPETVFPSSDALRDAIGRDIAQTRAYFEHQ